jgi:hypothetical protein
MVNRTAYPELSDIFKEISTPESVQYLLYGLLELVSKLYMPVIKNKSLLQSRSQDIIKVSSSY